MSKSKTVKLEAELTDVKRAHELNERVKAKKVELDWSDVTEVSPEFAQALCEGLEPDTAGDALGIATVSDLVAEVLLEALSSPKEKKAKKRKKKPKGRAPSQWTAPPSEPPPERPSSRPPEPESEPPRAPLLAAPPEAELREMLQDAVARDLLGPAQGPDEEISEGSPRDRYLVGMLAPRRLRVRPEEMPGEEVVQASGGEDGNTDSNALVAPTMFPSSIGLSFSVNADAGPLQATVRWGRYRRLPSEALETAGGKPKTVWKRIQVEQTVGLLPLSEGPIAPHPVGAEDEEDRPGAPAIVRGVARRVGTRFVVSLFLVNVQDEPKERRDEAWIFQPELELRAADGGAVFRPRLVADEAPTGETLDEERHIQMLYRNRHEFAAGHGVSVDADVSPDDPAAATCVRTKVIPGYDVAQQRPPTEEDEPKLAGLVLDMKELAETPRSKLGKKLRALPDAYQDWIKRQRKRIGTDEARLGSYQSDAAAALDRCEQGLARIRDGLALLAGNENAAKAFSFANRAMWLQRVRSVYAEARRQGRHVSVEELDIEKNRTWRTFQLAFVLLNLDSVTNLHHPHRSDPSKAVADLLWFPTGGGKTEAYLGLAAYTMGLRRLQGEIAGRSGEHGVAVLMRYTLRLLTLQQFQRATTLICACERIRREAEDAGAPIWGLEPFRIGLWVGARSTPNRTEHSAEALKRQRDVHTQQSSRVGGMGTPVQLKACPWCGTPIDGGKHIEVDSFKSGSGRTLMYCGDKYGRCPFTKLKAEGEGLPVVVVDEEIYRRLPTLLIATVDKFAQMPWNGAVQTLFGHVDQRCDRHGFASPDMPDTDHPKRGKLPRAKLKEHAPLRPPDLIIQDELHLISGPLGTLTGLYETAVDALCSWDVGGTRVRPKVVASTATVRRAGHQIHALFLRDVQVFPPQGLDVEDSFFSRQRPISELPGRRYIGICAPGRRLKAAIIRVYVAYLAAAQQLYDKYGVHADPWMTLVGYFSSLRELAGTRRLVDDDIASRTSRMDRRGLAKRYVNQTRELTSRLGSTDIPELLDWLEERFDPALLGKAKGKKKKKKRRPIDVLLATNMVSVGVDVRRLGLMVVAGQPKNTAEYIQATSRVGRAHPGVVCTIYNWARPRDLSHYETFEHYHATFYSHVEALSVTPFAPRALDRGLTALLVALVRLSQGKYAPNEAAGLIERKDPLVQEALDLIAQRAALVEESKAVGDAVRKGLERRLDEWLAEAAPKPGGARLGYKSRRDGITRPLLERAGLSNWETFTCLNSLRDVEPTADLVLEDGQLDDEPRRFTRGEP